MEMGSKLVLVDQDGKLTEYDVLFTFESEETGKSYVAYSDGSLDEDGDVEILASAYTLDAGEMHFEPIETEKEWRIIEIVLEELANAVRDAKNRGTSDSDSE